MQHIYVYQDLGASEFCVKSLMGCLRCVYKQSQFKVETITAEEILNSKLTQHEFALNSIMLCMGGGFDKGYEQALGERGTEKIKDFVRRGGNYLGICAGAYFATDYVQFDLDGPLQVLGQ